VSQNWLSGVGRTSCRADIDLFLRARQREREREREKRKRNRHSENSTHRVIVCAGLARCTVHLVVWDGDSLHSPSKGESTHAERRLQARPALRGGTVPWAAVCAVDAADTHTGCVVVMSDACRLCSVGRNGQRDGPLQGRLSVPRQDSVVGKDCVRTRLPMWRAVGSLAGASAGGQKVCEAIIRAIRLCVGNKRE
jgi:hypothetical protein